MLYREIIAVCSEINTKHFNDHRQSQCIPTTAPNLRTAVLVSPDTMPSQICDVNKFLNLNTSVTALHSHDYEVSLATSQTTWRQQKFCQGNISPRLVFLIVN